VGRPADTPIVDLVTSEFVGYEGLTRSDRTARSPSTTPAPAPVTPACATFSS
jgi:hypothetical protein